MITKEEAKKYLKLFEDANEKLEEANELFEKLEEAFAMIIPIYEKIKTIAEKEDDPCNDSKHVTKEELSSFLDSLISSFANPDSTEEHPGDKDEL